MPSPSTTGLESLQSTLESILSRLSALECQAGIPSSSVSSAPRTSSSTSSSSAPGNNEDELPPSLLAYDTHMKEALEPFTSACNSLEGLSKASIGSNLTAVWMGLRNIIVIGTKCQKPKSTDVATALMNHIKPVQDAIANINKASRKINRDYDWHMKAIMEMLVCASWVIMTSPPAPSSFIKETVGSTDFWSNKVRKQYKQKAADGGDDTAKVHIAFCDTLKALILDLSKYVKEYHLSGLMWNPRGIQLEQYTEQKPSTSSTTTSTSAASTASKTSGADIMKELAAKKNTDGSSAATGLRKVTREQQTWRKEYKADSTNTASTGTVKPSQIKKGQKSNTASTVTSTTTTKPPVCKFQTVGSKWLVEYQTKSSNPNGVCTVEINDPKEQVYIYKCKEATIQIKGKVKSVILDSSKKTNLIFDTAISSCEIVNCESVQIQSTGICPSFAIDKTDGCLVYISKEAITQTSFVTSKSTEMNVSWVDEKSGEQKEAPIPEQFVHRLKNGRVTSEVSDLYH